MLKEVDFSNFKPGGKKSGDGISFLRFERDKTYRIRPFGSAVEFYKIFVGKGKPSIIIDPDDRDAAAKLLSEHSGTEIRPSYRNAMFVIDRADGRIKILEGGSTIFEAFGNWSAAQGVKPGSGAAGDWTITATGDGVGGSNPRKYTTVYLGPVMFTDEEKVLITKLRDEGVLKLPNFLKETSLDRILEVAFGVESSSQAAAAAATATATATATPATDSVPNKEMDW